jgi:uncharacterized protein (DUF697 family)
VRLHPFTLLALLREVRRGAGDERPLGVAGAGELVPLLARELRLDGDATAVVEGRLEDVAALVWIGAPDEEQLRRASRAGVPIVAVADASSMPYVLPADIVEVKPGHGFPVEEICAALARRLGEEGTGLAARLPVLRAATAKYLIDHFSRRNAIIAAAVFIPGVDMPLLTLNQARMVLRLAVAYGQEIDRTTAAELLGVVGAGFALRAVARELLDVIPVGGWAVKGGVAYSGTRAIGEAAVRLYEPRA